VSACVLQDGGAGGSSTGNSRSVNPFTLNPHGHPAVNPAKSGTKSSVRILLNISLVLFNYINYMSSIFFILLNIHD